MGAPPRRAWARIASVVAIVVIAHGVVIGWFVLGSHDAPTKSAIADAAVTVAKPAPDPLVIAPTMDSVSAIPTATPTPTAAPDATSPVTPEPIEELSAFFRKPPGADEWTPDERRAYLRKMLAALDDKERALERELRAAERSGDKVTAEQKRVTLAHLRERKSEIVASIQRRLDASD